MKIIAKEYLGSESSDKSLPIKNKFSIHNFDSKKILSGMYNQIGVLTFHKNEQEQKVQTLEELRDQFKNEFLDRYTRISSFVRDIYNLKFMDSSIHNLIYKDIFNLNCDNSIIYLKDIIDYFEGEFIKNTKGLWNTLFNREYLNEHKWGYNLLKENKETLLRDINLLRHGLLITTELPLEIKVVEEAEKFINPLLELENKNMPLIKLDQNKINEKLSLIYENKIREESIL